MKVAHVTKRVETIRGLSGKEAARVGAAQSNALLAFVRTLSPEDWDRPTDCDLWSVKDIVCHVVGMAEGIVDLRELWRQNKTGKARKGEFVNPLAAMNQAQVDARSHLSPEEIIERLAQITPKVLRRREQLGRTLRYMPIYDGSVLGMSNLGYLVNPILSRDNYMHRVDIARATGREFPCDATDLRLAEDVLRDWVRRRDVDATITLDDSATYVAGAGRSQIRATIPDLMRVLSGRGDASEIDADDEGRAWIAAGVPF